jgi:uncharacterized SAM-binding protein YcdF (DUF218 family)
MNLFLLKKIIGFMLMPLSLVIILLFLSLLFYRKSPKFSFNCLFLGTLLLTISALAPVSDPLMAQLENKYQPFTRSSKPVDYIIVLGCGHTDDLYWSETNQLAPCSLQRLVEAIRIYQIHPEATIITSGGASIVLNSNAQAVKNAAISLGIPSNKILTEDFPKDTEEEAELISARIKGANSVLITNADHMRRSINYFNQYGAYPIAAPASPWVKGQEKNNHWGYYLPNIKTLKQTSTAWYETLGLVAQWFKTIGV